MVICGKEETKAMWSDRLALGLAIGTGSYKSHTRDCLREVVIPFTLQLNMASSKAPYVLFHAKVRFSSKFILAVYIHNYLFVLLS
jgi:hypothetical protein